ncbi:MAG: hypothetical protein QM478_10265 [Flavobacteriaceae bacterium]
MNIKEIKSIIFCKQSFYILCMFILFFPIQTQLQNLLYFLFDAIFRDGTISEIYTYNHTGRLLGCEQILEVREVEKTMNVFQKYGMRYINYLPSLLAFVILQNRWKHKLTFKLFDWTLTLIACFSIFNSIERIRVITYLDSMTFPQQFYFISTLIVFLFIGAYIFIKIFSFKERVQTLIIGTPTFLIGAILWFRFVGPNILPIDI